MELQCLGVTPAKAKQFNAKGIFSVEDLVAYLPRSYKDFTQETGLLNDPDARSVFILTLRNLYSGKGRSGVQYINAVGEEFRTKRKVRVTFFNQGYLYEKLYPYIGRNFYVAGKVSYAPEYDTFAVSSPELFEPMTDQSKRICPVYSKIQGMSEDYLTEKIKSALSCVTATEETLPHKVVEEQGLLLRRDAIFQLHNPKSMAQVEKAKERVLFDELTYFAIHNEWAKRASVPGSPFSIITVEKFQQLKQALPYKLTNDQEKAVISMLESVRAGKRLNALVQGDVGCGKTIVALLLMVAMADNGYQAALMAPTQLLAVQHYEDISKLVAPLGLHVVFLGSNMKAADKKKVVAEIKSGTANLIVGTHAVFSKDVEFNKLALTVVDEEHKFGVAQRAALAQKAEDGVHSISMSATPIPRTLASIIYGETLQLHNIHTMPEGRKPVITGLGTTWAKLARFILKEKEVGHQTYVVCPLIDASDSEGMEGVLSVEEVAAQYEQELAPYGVRIKTLSGKDSKTVAEQTINEFAAGEIDVLVATTVVEVGVNVPTATLMVISNAERFGLASLHQLRGRVGRSELQSYCVLCANNPSEMASQRLATMCETTDGFAIAEADLKLRGAGDLLGTKQSGDNKYMTLMMLHPEVYEKAQKVARHLLDSGSSCPLVRRVQSDRAANEK